MAGSRAMYADGWKITTNHVGPTPTLERDRIPGSHEFDSDRWALFRLVDDFAETNDVAEQHPEVVSRLVDLWWQEARRNDVLPLNDGWFGRTEPVRSLSTRCRRCTVVSG
jgi:arylsulfatase